jgi:hypothetical protein
MDSTISGVLLRQFYWNKEKLLEKYTEDPSGILESVGLSMLTHPGARIEKVAGLFFVKFVVTKVTWTHLPLTVVIAIVLCATAASYPKESMRRAIVEIYTVQETVGKSLMINQSTL